MNVAMMQPSFMPWQGFFELIRVSDTFVLLDDFQFSVQSYHQRNRLFVNRGQVDWYSVPVRKSVSFKEPLNKTMLNEATPWRKKMWKRIQTNYSRADFYPEIAPFFEKWLFAPAESLAAFNSAFIMLVCELLGLKREFRLSSSFPSKAQRSMRVLELLQWCSATRYYSAKGAYGYMKEEGLFPVDKLEVLFQDYNTRAYCQICSPDKFVPFLSVLDALLNIGPAGTLQLISSGTEKWTTWDDMNNNANQSLATEDGNCRGN